MIIKYVFLALILALSACTANSFPVYGHAERVSDNFTGKAYEPYIGSGGIELQLKGGGTCKGHYRQIYVRDGTVHGNGDFDCVGGLTGTFTYQGSTQNGQGLGTFSDGTRFNIAFGADQQ